MRGDDWTDKLVNIGLALMAFGVAGFMLAMAYAAVTQ